MNNISLTNFNSTNMPLLDTRSNSKCLRQTYNLGCLEGVQTVSMGCPKYVWGEQIYLKGKAGIVKLVQVIFGQVMLGQVKSGHVQS